MLDRIPFVNRFRFAQRWNRRKGGLLCFFFSGVFLGYILTPMIRFGDCGEGTKIHVRSAGPLKSLIDYASELTGQTTPVKNDFVIINIITAEMFLETRATNVHKTWAQHIPGKVLFMAKHGTDNTTFNNSLNMPVVRLRGVDDTYPPQKKSFLSMRYAYDTYINDYEWFIRADDDVYIKGEKLNEFLRDLNSSVPMYIGVPGRGKEHELGILGLKAEDNYCMGGPGMIFSRETIRRVGPNIHQCIKDLYSDHEDVEIGRCIRRFARVNCTWNYEMSDFFYQNYADYHGSYTNKGALEQTHKAITLHPIKQPPHMYRIHNYFLGIKIYDKRDRITHLVADIKKCEEMVTGINPDPPLSRIRDNVAPWTFMDKKRIYDPLAIHPAKGLHLHAFHDAYPIIKDTIFNIENVNRTHDDEMNKKFYNMEQGYMRVNGKYATEYMMQFLVESKYAKNKKYAATRPIDYRIWVTQPFQEPEIKILDYPVMNEDSVDAQVEQAMSDPTSPIILTKTIHFIMPLAGRLSTFLRFIGMMEDIGFKYNEDISLTVVQYPHPENDSRAEVIQTMNSLSVKYPHYKDRLNTITVNTTFTRGGGLTVGSDNLPRNDSLMYFIDVDIMLTRDTLNRIRSNTIQYRQAYYPVVFSQYDPDAACQKPKCPKDSFHLNRYNGYWRAFGFGIAAMYKSDLNIVGGFDRSIVGWGKEDVDLFEKFVKSNITVFRTTDPGQVHIFHKIICDPNLEASQYRMCFNTKAASFASMYTLSERVLNTKVLMDFDVSSFNFSKMAKGKPAAPAATVAPAASGNKTATAPAKNATAPAAANATTTASKNTTSVSAGSNVTTPKPADKPAAPTTPKPAAATTAKPTAATTPKPAAPAAPAKNATNATAPAAAAAVTPAAPTAKPASNNTSSGTAANATVASTAKPATANSSKPAAVTTPKPSGNSTTVVDPKQEAKLAAAAVPAAAPAGGPTAVNAAAAPAAPAPAAAPAAPAAPAPPKTT